MKRSKSPLMVAIVGGSGAGKTWLADRLARRFGRRAVRLSLDDFYRDRSHLSPARRRRINYDHPRAIDWKCFEQVLKGCREWRAVRRPQYDFMTHTRFAKSNWMRPGAVILVDGLWLLRSPRIRRMFRLAIFVDCPKRTRLARRLARDASGRGRSAASVREQFLRTVEPMHERFIQPQIRRAQMVLKQPVGTAQVRNVTELLRENLKMV